MERWTVRDYLDNGQVVQIEYDREGDVLDILFALRKGRDVASN